MKTLVSTLSGPELHYWTARADGRLEPHIKDGECLITHGEGGPVVRFDEAWFALQIMPREGKAGLRVAQPPGEAWYGAYAAQGIRVEGANQFEAAQRAFVTKVLGAEVE